MHVCVRECVEFNDKYRLKNVQINVYLIVVVKYR